LEKIIFKKRLLLARDLICSQIRIAIANDVEKVHADLYQKTLDNLGTARDVDYYVCSVCGYTCEDEAPDSCPVCGAKAKAFVRVD
jgi:rubrerythrin